MLADTALRLAAVNLLCPAEQLAADAPVYPTIAGAKVYDSRLDPDDAFSGDATETGPVIVVYTEETRTQQREGGEAIPHRHMVRLTVMASFYVRDQVTLSGPDGEETRWVAEIDDIADAWQEMTLDCLAAQIHRRMTLVDSDPATDLYATLLLGIEQVSSIPLRDPSRTSRSATRTMEYVVEIPDDKWPEDTGVAGLDALPHPLSSVAAALPETSRARRNCEALAAQMRAPVAMPPPLAGVFVHINADGSVPIVDGAQMTVEATTEGET